MSKNSFKWKATLLLGVLAFFVHAQSLTTSQLHITADEAELHGTYILADPKKPVVLIIAGSGPTDRDGNNPMAQNNSLKLLAEGLAEHGYSSLRYDKRGIGKSTTTRTEADMRFTDFSADVSAWVTYLREEQHVERIVILGHSEGALLGLLAAQSTPVEAYISLAGPGRPAGVVLREQLSAQPEAVVAMTDPILDELERGQVVDSVFPLLYSLFRPSIQPYLISWMAYDPSEELRKLTCAKLVIQGTTDIQVGESDVAALESSDPEAKVVRIEGMNHILKNAPADRSENMATYSQPDLPLHEGLIPAITDFLDVAVPVRTGRRGR